MKSTYYIFTLHKRVMCLMPTQGWDQVEENPLTWTVRALGWLAGLPGCAGIVIWTGTSLLGSEMMTWGCWAAAAVPPAPVLPLLQNKEFKQDGKTLNYMFQVKFFSLYSFQFIVITTSELLLARTVWLIQLGPKINFWIDKANNYRATIEPKPRKPIK